MTFTRGLAAGAMFAGLALVLTAPAATADPLNGHYTETETFPDGHQAHSDWQISPCGDGCASVNDLGQAHLVNGQWVLDSRGGVSCESGGDVKDAVSLHYTWDPNTLAGQAQITNNVPACGNPQGYQETNPLQLTLVP